MYVSRQTFPYYFYILEILLRDSTIEYALSLSLPQGKQVTSHPCVQQQLEQSGDYCYSEARVCQDGTVITSRGPGSCFEFALAIVTALVGEQVARDVAGPMMLPTKN